MHLGDELRREIREKEARVKCVDFSRLYLYRILECIASGFGRSCKHARELIEMFQLEVKSHTIDQTRSDLNHPTSETAERAR